MHGGVRKCNTYEPTNSFWCVRRYCHVDLVCLEKCSSWWILIFALACGASSLYGWLAGTWPFGVVEGVWALVALRRWWVVRQSQ